jgi:3-deoxy-D-manno-octulosonic-acid transferase
VPDDAPVLLGGSTFPGEERILAEVYCALRREFPRLLLILVPRHIERTDEVLRDLAPLGLRVALRTSPATTTGGTPTTPEVFLVNTTGELRDWYHLATVVFMGKSLTATGGQNPVEPVMAGKPVLFGPHMENFEPIVTQWLAADAATQIAHAEMIPTTVAALLRDPARRNTLSERARAIASAHAGATERTARRLLASARSA